MLILASNSFIVVIRREEASALRQKRLLRIGGKRIKARPSSEGWKYLLKVGELKSISFKHWAADGLGGEAAARAAA